MNFDVKDINILANAIGKHYSAKSPTAVNGTNRFIYMVPKQEKDINTILSTLEKYGVKAQTHNSSLSPIPIVRVPWTQNMNIDAPNFFPLLQEIEKMQENIASGKKMPPRDIPKEPAPQNDTLTQDAPGHPISEYNRKKQQYQIKTLKDLTGLDFRFVPADKSPLQVKSYVCKCANSDEQSTAYNILANNDLAVSGSDGNDLIVTENFFERDRAMAAIRKQDNPEKFAGLVTDSIGKINGHDVYLEPFFKSSIVESAGRAIVAVNINGKSLPFYVSSGQAGKDAMGIPSGRWYPLVGIGEYWFNKMPDMMHNPYPELDRVVDLLEKRFPAAELKQIALGNRETKLRHVENDYLMKIVNKDFPEGVQHHYNQRVYERTKNIDVYLPAIIHAWRTPATGYLETYDNAISVPVDNLIQKIQRKLHAEVTQTNGMIQFLPNDNQTKSMIRANLEKMGFAVGENLEISATDLMNQYMHPQKQQGFASGKQRIEKKGFMEQMYDKLQSFIGRK